ncbi:hypothetical protein [Fervidicella metallireducens]|nr:hypothetical protein [Fervidicella metallireducens]
MIDALLLLLLFSNGSFLGCNSCGRTNCCNCNRCCHKRRCCR